MLSIAENQEPQPDSENSDATGNIGTAGTSGTQAFNNGFDNVDKKSAALSSGTTSDNHEKGTPPPPDIADGGVEGEEKQPKERTGHETQMGGATGGQAGLGKQPDTGKDKDSLNNN